MSRQFYETYGLDYELSIQSKIGGDLQIINLMVIELNMYEDMFGPFMRMEVVINDSLGLIDKLPIVGDEELTFTYGNPNEQQFEQTFVVYKVAGRTNIKDRAQVYTLHAISREGHKNSLEYVYKPFIDKKPHEIATDIYDNYLKSGDKMLRAIRTDNVYSKVTSGQNPVQVLNQLAKEAQGPYKASSYLFFENKDDFYFAPLSFFYTGSADPFNFFLSVPNEQPQLEKGKGAFPARSIKSIKYLDSFDNLDVVHRGAYYNEVNIIDPILKRFVVHPLKNADKKKYQFDYKKNWDDLDHLPNSGEKFISEAGELGKAKKAYSTHRRLMLSNIAQDNETYQQIGYLEGKTAAGDQLNAPRVRHEHLSSTAHESANISTNVVEITTPGIAELAVGTMVKINIPQPTQLAGEHMKFLLLYGQEATFIITAIRHHYDTASDVYSMVLSCSKESFGEVPTPKAFDHSREE